MTLKEANKELEKLENEYNYWLKQKENLLNLVMPKATDIRGEVVDGGKREDRLLKYVELEDEKQINATLDYIWKRKNNLMNWIDEELRIMGKYNELEKRIYELRNDEHYIKKHGGKKREWWKVAQMVGLSLRQVQRINSRATRKRNDE